MTQFQPHRSIN